MLARAGLWVGKPCHLSSDYQVAALLEAHAADCLVDVGANRGQFASAVRRAGYRGPVVSLEPVPEAFAELRSRSAHDPNWTVHRVGVADRVGDFTLNISESTPISSFLSVTDDYVVGRPPAKVQRTESVPVTTLDRLLGDEPYECIFLKTDTQGYDLQVLAGASDIIDRVIGIQIELSVVPIYEGMPNYVEALTVLREMGFILAGMHRVPSFQIHEFDGVFVRSPDVP
jgi:FkbM family methyltransferase